MFASKDIFLKSSGGAYQISRSVRTRSSASAYFNRTLTTPTNNKIWTWSGWVKRGTLGAAQTLFSGQVDVNNWGIIAFLSGDTLSFQQADAGSVTSTVTTTQVFRDSSAWYHIIVVFDSTQATAANRLKMYVNGVQITAFGTATYLAQNTASRINTAIAHQISRYISAAQYFDGYMTEVNFIDGQALTPSSFGETNAITGVWQPKAYSGTYGTNGFELNFSDNSTAAALGTDFSGNSNTWTVNNISVTAGATYDSMLDVPTLYADGGNGRGNYPIMSPIDKTSIATVSNGNLKVVSTAGGYGLTRATMAIPSTGKFYFEVTLTTGTTDDSTWVGVIDSAETRVFSSGWTSTVARAYVEDGRKQNGVVSTSYGTSYTSGDVIGIAVDMTNGAIYFAKNNTWQNSGDPTSGATKTGAAFTDMSTAATGSWIPFCHDDSSQTPEWNWTFGQRPFTYTPPTGFVALNTQNLPTPTISNGASYMAATTYTGTLLSNAVSNAVNGVSFQPDLVWIKSRSAATDNELTDSVRGVTLSLTSNSAAAEATDLQGLTAFNSGGFTVGTNTTYNNLAATYVGWQWNAGGSTVTNTSGTISAQVRANATAGFSVVTYTGNGTSGATVGHGLGVAPAMMIIKLRNSTENWPVYHKNQNASPANGCTYLSLTNAYAAFTGIFNNTVPTSSVFTLGNNAQTNGNTNTYVAYCFAAVAGYSAFGSYTGNGSADGPFTYLGFRPRFIMFKRTDSTGSWFMEDSSRGTYNVMGPELYAESSAAEATSNRLDFLSNGFKMRAANAGDNANGGTYIYMAFAENPFKLSLAR